MTLGTNLLDLPLSLPEWTPGIGFPHARMGRLMRTEQNFFQQRSHASLGALS